MKKGVIGIATIIGLVLLALAIVEVPYTIRSRGLIMPVEEWSLVRSPGGVLLQMQENHFSGLVNQYSISEFQRGDVARYVFNEELLGRGKVEKGDTVAWVYTSDVHMEMIALQGELAYQRSVLEVYLTGERPEEIAVAEGRIELAEQELGNQEKQTERVIQLYLEGVVPRQEYELAVNELKVKEYALEIARSQHQALVAGRKTADLEMVRSRIASLELQVDQLVSHMAAFHLVSPISGMVIRDRNPLLDTQTESVLRIADFSSFMVFLPVDYHENQFTQIGQTVLLRSASGFFSREGRVVSIDNTVRLMNNRPKIFLGATVDGEDDGVVFRNMMVEARVVCDTIRLWEFMNRMTRGVFQN
jgi:hypothetical protein